MRPLGEFGRARNGVYKEQLFSLPGRLPPNPKGYHNYLGKLPSKACVY